MGREAVIECIDYLRTEEPVPLLETFPEALCRAAMDHVEDQGSTGKIGHDGADGSTHHDRMARHCHAEYTGECIAYAAVTEPSVKAAAREFVQALLIDDGVPDRGHRHCIFTSNFKHVGISCGTHTKYEHMLVIDFAEVVGPKKPKIGKTRLTLRDKMLPQAEEILGLLPSTHQKAFEEMVEEAINDSNKTVLMDYIPQSLTNGHTLRVTVESRFSSCTNTLPWGEPLR